MENDGTIRIKLYRSVMGVRTPYNLVLDGRRNVMSEQVDQEELSRSTFREPLAAPLGVQAPQGSSSWFVAEASNPFSGSELLRAEYFRRVRETEEEHARNGTTCSDCELGGLINEFKIALRERGFPL